MFTKIDVEDKDIILFDGVCNLCNGLVKFVIRRDNDDHFRFATLQSELGKVLLRSNPDLTAKMNSIVLVTNGNIFTRSDAALRIAKHLKGIWKLSSVFLIIPPFIRDFVYDIVARNRYRWFGKKDKCMVPTTELSAKFLTE